MPPSLGRVTGFFGGQGGSGRHTRPGAQRAGGRPGRAPQPGPAGPGPAHPPRRRARLQSGGTPTQRRPPASAANGPERGFCPGRTGNAPPTHPAVPEPRSPRTIPAVARVTSKDITSQHAAAWSPQRAPAASSTPTLHHIASCLGRSNESPQQRGAIGYKRLGGQGKAWLRPPSLGRAEATSGLPGAPPPWLAPSRELRHPGHRCPGTPGPSTHPGPQVVPCRRLLLPTFYFLGRILQLCPQRWAPGPSGKQTQDSGPCPPTWACLWS